MKIAFITQQGLNTTGGPPRYVANLARSVQSKGFQTQILAGASGAGAIVYRSCPVQREWDIVRSLLSFRPDAIHVHGHIHLILPALIAKTLLRGNSNIVFTFHTQPYLRDFLSGYVGGRPDYIGMKRVVARWLLRKADSVASVSSSIVDNLNGRYRMGIVHSATIPSACAPLSAHAKDADRPRSRDVGAGPVLVSIGVFSWDWKVAGHLICMDAVVELKKKFPEIKLLIAGDGAFRELLESKVRACGLESNVTLLGNIDDVGSILSGADVYVHMGLNEGCPLAVVEAMMAGKPIVAANAGGIPELIEHGVTGILVEPNAGKVAAAIDAVLAAPEKMKAIGSAAAVFASKNLTWERIAQSYVMLYENAGGSR